MAVVATVLYEDQFGPRRKFGLHTFLVRCACDQCDIQDHERHIVEGSIECRPMKGNSKLLRFIRQDLALLANDGRQVIAVFDNDKVRELLDLPKHAPDGDVVQAITKPCEQAYESLHIMLLKENTESILQAASECGGAFEAETFERAVRYKELPAREILFQKIAASAQKALRDCIRARIPSLLPLVGVLAQTLCLIPPLGARTHQ